MDDIKPGKRFRLVHMASLDPVIYTLWTVRRVVLGPSSLIQSVVFEPVDRLYPRG